MPGFRKSTRSAPRGANLASALAALGRLAHSQYHQKPSKHVSTARATSGRRGMAGPNPRFGRKKKSSGSSQPYTGLAFVHGRAPKTSTKFINKVRLAVEAKNVYLTNSTYRMPTTVGTCDYIQGPQINDPTTLNAINANMAGGGVNEKFQVISATSVAQVTNMSNASSFVRVYECMCRQDTPANITGSSIGGTPWVYLYDEGMTDLPSAGSASANDLSSTLFMSTEFTTRCSILKVKTVEFRPGETRRFTLVDKKPWVLNMARIVDGTGLLLCGLAKRTRFLIFQVWGDTADSTTGTVTTTSVTATSLSVVQNNRYEYSWTQDYSNNIYRGTALPTTLTTATDINDLTGATQVTTFVP